MQEPQQEPFSPSVHDGGTSPSRYNGDSNSFWEEPQQNVPRGHARRSMGTFATLSTHMSAEFNEELIYGNTRSSRLSSPLRRKRHTISTPDSAHAPSVWPSVWQRPGMGPFQEDQLQDSNGAADRAAAAGVMPVMSAPASAADPPVGGLSGAAVRAKDACQRAQSRRSTASTELLIQMRACEQVLENAKQIARNQADALHVTRGDSTPEGDSPACQSPAGAFVTRARAKAASQPTSERQGDGIQYHTEPHHGGTGFEGEGRAQTVSVPSPSSAYPSLRPQRVHRKLGSIGKLKPLPDFPDTAPAMRTPKYEPKHEIQPQRKRSVVDVWKSSLWAAGSKPSESRATPRSATASAQPSHSESLSENPEEGRSRGARRGRSSRWGFRSPSGATHASAGHSSSLPPTMQSFRSDADAVATGGSFMNALEELETTVDLPLTISARESYSSLPSAQALTHRASLHSQSGRVACFSGPLSGGLSGALGGSQHGGHSRPDSARATRNGGTYCRPWLALRLSKIQDREFARFLAVLLECCFISRPTASQALQHPWLSYGNGMR